MEGVGEGGKGKVGAKVSLVKAVRKEYGKGKKRADDVGLQVWFGGDTGFCSVRDGQYGMDETLPVCPAFKEIGEKFGGFDLGLIPIGWVDGIWLL